MRLKGIASLAVALACVGVAATAHAQSKRPAVAVMDFDYGTVDNWWGQYDIGKGMADQVIDALVNDGTFRVIERKKLDTVLAEQDFAHSDRADPSAAKLAKIGKVLGVKYIIAGSITKFSNEKRGGGVRVHGIGVGGAKAKTEVNLTARVIDATTGEIVASVKGHGESSKGGGFNFSSSEVGLGTHSDEWRNSAIGDAQERACNDFVAGLVAKKDRFLP
ncbi:MAG TPA: CsgG/HfaB family protein [Vicinamibacteria bacterium]|nr:CsgG/HfaB family protein [Vicinamibacteria bacterium]